MPRIRKAMNTAKELAVRRLTLAQLMPAFLGLGAAVMLGMVDRLFGAEARGGSAGITSAALGAIVALAVFNVIKRK